MTDRVNVDIDNHVATVTLNRPEKKNAVDFAMFDGIRAAALPILYAGALSVGVAYTLQIVAQREAPPGHVAIILSLEAVFAAVGGGLLLGERLGSRGLIGCALMLAGAVVSKLSAGPPERQREDARST